jgi:sugar lactone lactonase YvrE
MPEISVENVTGPVAYHAEGPVWWPGWGGLRYVDMLAGDLLTLRPDGGVDRLHVGDHAAVVRPRTGAGFVVGLARSVAVADDDGAPTRLLATLVDDPTVRLNEGAAGPDGAFYAGGQAEGERPSALYRVEVDGSSRVVLEGIEVSNGLGFSPDGLTVDAEGGVWVAHNHNGTVRRYTSDGALDAIVEVPPRQVTACAFGGERLDELYMTTSRENLPPGEDPLAGALFRAEVGVQGLPVREFAG